MNNGRLNWRWWTMVVVLLLLGACQTDLYTQLNEREANEMMAALLEAGIDCKKTPGRDQSWVLSLAKRDIVRAVNVLNRLGYPRVPFDSMGQVFEKKGLISSPLEERVRYIYALSQEISATLTHIDGIVAARVHVVLPENDPLSHVVTPSSASVFIKHRLQARVDDRIPEIKKLVVNSIEGLTYEKVTVVLFPAECIAEDRAAIHADLIGDGRSLTKGHHLLPWVMVVASGLTLLCLGYLARRWWLHRQAMVGKDES